MKLTVLSESLGRCAQRDLVQVRMTNCDKKRKQGSNFSVCPSLFAFIWLYIGEVRSIGILVSDELERFPTIGPAHQAV